MVATQRTPEPSLRRAAILLSNLDADNRRRLLAHLPPQDAARVRAAAAALSDVDPLEVRRTVSAFVGRISAAQRPASTAAPAAATAESRHPESRHAQHFSSTGQPEAAGVPSERTGSGPVPGAPSRPSSADSGGGLKFLNDVSDATLLRAIGSEHPQTIAVVLASIAPHQAARLLQQLAPQARGEAIRRLSRLEEVPQDVIDDIGRHLRGLIGTVDQVGSGEGRRLLTSIFSALGAEDRQALGAGLADTDGGIAAALAEAAQAEAARATSPAAQSPPSNQPSAEQGNRASTTDSSVGQENGAVQGQAGPVRAERDGSPSARAGESSDDDGDESAPHILPLASHALGLQAFAALPEVAEASSLLENLPAERLRQVLADLTAREALLTLCGLTPRCVRRLLRAMPRRAAKEVRQRLHALGPLDLSDIDRAKQKAAAVAAGSAPHGTARAA